MSVINKPDLKIFAQDAKTGEIEAFPDVLRGWGITLDMTAGKPPLEWFNALSKRVDEWLMYLTQRGVAEWDISLSYPQTAIVQFNGVIYVSVKETKGEQPDKSQLSWSTLGRFLGLEQYATTAELHVELNKKFDKANISGVKGNENDKAPSLNLFTTEVSKLQIKGDYATKEEVNSKFDAANTAANNANNNANGRVPNTRRVNNKPLSADITLSAGDVGAYTKAETDTKVADAKKAGTDAQVTANAANTAATNANNNANGRVPNTRKVNNKPLSTDITLSAGDVGAYTKTESDARYMQNALNVRLGAKTRYSPSSNRVSWNWEAPAGNVLTGLVVDETGSNSADNISGAWYRPLQSLVNGQWVTISGL
ncbi:TPA: hypothetical protein ACS72U_003955 [Providencia alcalifaciens]